MIQYVYTQKRWIKFTWLNKILAALNIDFVNIKYIHWK